MAYDPMFKPLSIQNIKIPGVTGPNTGVSDLVAFVILPKDANTSPIRYVSISLSVRTLSAGVEGISLSDLVNALINVYTNSPQAAQDFKRIDSGTNETLAGRPAYFIINTANYGGQGSIF
jgi:hypothetical protein